MNDAHVKSRQGAAIYYAVSGLLSPIVIAGYALWIAKILAGRRSGVSWTAQGPIAARWLQHKLGTRRDEASNRLMPVLPGISPVALRLVSGPLLVAHHASGYVPRAFRYPFEGKVPPQYEASARVSFFDEAVDRYLQELDQLVILGAGFDTRVLRLPNGVRARCFEVDMPNTQTVKREALKRAGIDASAVTFVPADFEKDDWFVALVRTGFDPAKPALFLWEGVTMYLDREAIVTTLREIGTLAKGTVVAFDYFTSEALESKAPYWRYARATTRAVGEPLKFGIDSTPPSQEHLAELLRTCGLSLVKHETLGQDTADERAWGGFAVAAVT